jgi:NADH:ubiquinone reductase (H+-translocating)
LEDATTLRRRILLAFERAEREDDEAKQAALLTFVIIGAGPTRVELAGTIAELARATLPQDFRNIDTRKARIVLIEAGPRVGAQRRQRRMQPHYRQSQTRRDDRAAAWR